MRKISTLFIILLSSLSIWADGVKIDGINYNLSNADKTAYVTYTGQNIYETDYKGDIVIPDSVTYTLYEELTYAVKGIASSAFYNAAEVTSITFPATISFIGTFAFRGCSGLTSIIIPESISEIGEQTFRGCTGLTTLTIPAAVKKIGNMAFRGATGIKEIHCESAVPPVCDGDIFLENEYANVTLYVPGGAVEAYQTAETWKNFKTVTSAVETVDAKANNDGKFIQNGQIFIRKNGHIYNLLGTEVR